MQTDHLTKTDEPVTVYTDAPKAYDYWYVTEVDARAAIDTRGKIWRRVELPAMRLEAQSARYRSGWHAAMPPRDFAQAIGHRLVTAAHVYDARKARGACTRCGHLHGKIGGCP
jgi:hypothetical protein